jgi:predicted phosphoribosyltransferase
MIFKDRRQAGERLAGTLKNDPYIKRRWARSRVVAVSLLRGGIIVGDIIAKNLKIDHRPLAVAKIPAPGNPELAIGALSFDVTYLEPKVVSSLALDKATIQNQIGAAREKFKSYQQRFSLEEKKFNQLKNKAVILVDDGIATGSSMKAALLFVKSKKPKKIFLAVPVAPTDFEGKGFDKVFILHRDLFLSAVSQFYENFPQVEDNEVKSILQLSVSKI